MKKTICILFSIILVACSNQSKNSQQDIEQRRVILFPEEIWENGEYELVEDIVFDFNNDRVNDTIRLYSIKDWNDPGDFHKIQVNSSNNKLTEIYNCGDWQNLKEVFFKDILDQNACNSERVLVYKVSGNRNLLIIFGYSYASTPGKLSIFDLSDEDVKVLFQMNFELKELKDLNSDGIEEFIGWRYYSEGSGYSDSVSTASAYHPYYVLRLDPDTIVLDEALSETYNHENYFGYFGLEYDRDGRYLIVEPSDDIDSSYRFEPYFYFEKYRKYYQTSIKYLTETELKGYTKSELRLIRNEIFAFHGYTFTSEDLKEYFEKQEWYKASDQDIQSRLNKYERANIELIQRLENE